MGPIRRAAAPPIAAVGGVRPTAGALTAPAHLGRALKVIRPAPEGAGKGVAGTGGIPIAGARPMGAVRKASGATGAGSAISAPDGCPRARGRVALARDAVPGVARGRRRGVTAAAILAYALITPAAVRPTAGRRKPKDATPGATALATLTRVITARDEGRVRSVAPPAT